MKKYEFEISCDALAYETRDAKTVYLLSCSNCVTLPQPRSNFDLIPNTALWKIQP